MLDGFDGQLAVRVSVGYSPVVVLTLDTASKLAELLDEAVEQASPPPAGGAVPCSVCGEPLGDGETVRGEGVATPFGVMWFESHAQCSNSS